MKDNTTILGLHARTSIAAGTGQNLGAIDLPIMREAPTDYPVIFGSAFKGALREKFETEKGEDAAKVYFGDDSSGGSKYAGAVIVSDARLLLLPVRSMTTHFKWVTCPYILKRFANDLRMLGETPEWTIPIPAEQEAIVAAESSTIYLEEYALDTRQADISTLIQTFDSLMEGDLQESLEKQIVIVQDDMFAYLSRFATPVTPHIAIDNVTKTVKTGALWYEETLPSETLLYSMLITNASRKEGDTATQAKIIRNNIVQHLRENDFVQVGGNETVGMGWCKVVCHA